MNESSQPQVFVNVPSPFCGIASDDLKIEVTGLAIKVLENGDGITVPGFEHPLGNASPRIAGDAVPLERAVNHAAYLLGDSRLPVFSGFGTDVNDTRAALSLIERCGGIFDQARAEGGLRNLLVLADSGWMATTLGELKNRVDVLLVFGSDIESAFPRFFERFVWPRDTLFGQDTGTREVIYLGPTPGGAASSSPNGRASRHIPCAADRLPAVAAALSALAKGAKLQGETVAGVRVSELQELVERLRKARYSVVTWVAGQLNFPHAELAVQQICRFVVTLNQETRCSVLPLGGQDGDRTASQVCAWLTGYPTRVSFARGYPEYDPYHNSAARLLEQGEADLLVWVNSHTVTPPPVADVPIIVIGRSGMTFQKEPEVFIPVGAPGIDHGGHMYRCDNVVAVPLYQLRDSGLPSAAKALAEIEAAL